MTTLRLSPVRVRRRRSGRPVFARRWEQLDDWLRRREDVGVTTGEIHAAGFRNASQVAGDLAAQGVELRSRVEPTGTSAHHVRYWHAEHAPAGTSPVKPAGPHSKSSVPPAPKADVSRAGAPGRSPSRAASVPPTMSLLDLLEGDETERRAA